MSIRPEAWPRPLQTSVIVILCWAMLFCSYAFFLRWLMSRLNLRLSAAAKQKGMLRDEFDKFAAQSIVAITTHVFLGPLAFHNFWMYQFSVPLHVGLSAFTFPPIDEYWVLLDLRTCYLAEVFAGNMIYQILFWFLGWEKGWDMLGHHIGFFVACVLLFSTVVYGKLAISALSMELSSPFLSLYLLTRMLDGEAWALVSKWSMMIFGFVFVVMRLGFYSFTVLEFQYLFWWRFELFPPWTPMILTWASMIVFTLGWVLQLIWGRLVVSKALKAIMR